MGLRRYAASLGAAVRPRLSALHRPEMEETRGRTAEPPRGAKRRGTPFRDLTLTLRTSYTESHAIRCGYVTSGDAGCRRAADAY